MNAAVVLLRDKAHVAVECKIFNTQARHHTLLADPALLGAELAALPASRTVVLDEIQRVKAIKLLRRVTEPGLG